jgi:hypothetical protein
LRKLPGLNYSVTEDGKVYSHRRNHLLKPEVITSRNKGYLRVCLSGTHYMVHRLVAEVYVPNPENKPFVNHIDKDTRNNHKDNLEWVTSQENAEHSLSKSFTMLDPNGTETVIFNLQKFCRENNLTQANMWKVLVGERAHHKGWKRFEPS